MFTNRCTYLLVLQCTKIYLKFTLKCSYMFRSVAVIRELYWGLAKVTNVKISVKIRRYKLCSGVAAYCVVIKCAVVWQHTVWL
jgi:hypothetical protein